MAVNINIPSQVSQTITDGVTDKAPSEDAVFDALALKANTADLGATAFSNDYNDLDNLPTLPSGTVTSVGLNMPSAFSVSNSPITSSGDIAVTGAGVASQYVRGDGSLANFPTTSGGGASVNYYLNGSVSQGTFGGSAYYELSKTPVIGAGTNFTRTNAQGNGYIASFITDAGDPNLLNIPGGNWNLEFYFNSSSNGGSPSFYAELYKVDLSNAFTLIASGVTNPEGITNGTTVDQYFTSIPVPQTTILATDRIAIRIFVIPGGRNITLHTEDNNLSQIITTFSTGLNALNSLTAQVQYFGVGTSGTDFNIDSVTDTHTFNLPTASATNRGALSTSDWTAFNGKQAALVSGTNIKTINGTSVLGSGDITVGGGINVGTTAVTSGTDTRVFFQQGGVVQQDANFTFNNTQKRLTLRASGTASTDVPFVVRNSADSANLATIQGDGAATFGTYTNPNTRLTATGTTLGAYISGNTGIYAQSNTTTGTLYAIDCLGRALSGANTSYGIRAISDTNGVGSVNYAGRFQASGNATNYAGYFDAVNGTSNYAIITQRGNSGFGQLTPTARVDILAPGALSTDLAFRVRNSVDNTNLLTAVGTGEVFIGNSITPSGQNHLFNIRNGLAASTAFAYFDNASYNFDVDRYCNVKLGFNLLAVSGGTHSLALGLGTPPSSRNYQQTIAAWTAISQGTNDSGFAQTGADTAGNNSVYTNYYGRNIVLGGTTQGTGTRKIVLYNGTAPTTTIATAGQLYVEGGELKFRGSSGTITVVAPA